MRRSNGVESARMLFALVAISVSLQTSPAQEPVTFTYSFSNLFDGQLQRTVGLTEYEMLRAVEEGLALWASVAPVTFVETEDIGPAVSKSSYSITPGMADIRIGHIDLEGGTLGEAYLPSSNDGLASDVHIDSSNRTWNESLFFTVLTHELGHAIDLSHIEGQTAIMNPVVDETLKSVDKGFLFAADISSVQRRWGVGTGDVVTERVWKEGVNSRWSTDDNWNEQWRPTRFAAVSIAGDSKVTLSSINQHAKSVQLGIGSNELKVSNIGSLAVRDDIVLGTLQGGDRLIVEGATAKTFVPSSNAIEDSWYRQEFNDQNWLATTTGIGFEFGSGLETLIETDISRQMFRNNSSVYTRLHFDVANPEQFDALSLRLKYDDGFVAYLNGTRVASSNSPRDVTWNSTSSAARNGNQALNYEAFDLTAQRGLLNLGGNVLAIQGLNQSRNDGDFLVLPELIGGRVDNILNVDKGNLEIGGDLILAHSSGSQSELRIDGSVEILGNLRKGEGFGRISMSGGTLTVRNRTEASVHVNGQSTANYLIPRNDQVDGIWTATRFEDDGWETSDLAIGFDRRNDFGHLISTDIEDEMFNRATSVYARAEFELDNVRDLRELSLRMKYSDGFAAYLNGTLIAAQNTPENLAWNSTAIEPILNRSLRDTIIDLSEHLDQLVDGSNVLAIHGLSPSRFSDQFFLLPELTVGTVDGTIEVDQLNFNGGSILGVGKIVGDFRQFNGEFSPAGAFETSTIHQLEVQGAYRVETQSALAIDFDNQRHDSIDVDGSAEISGSLRLRPDETYEDPVERGAFEERIILTSQNLTGKFSQIEYAGKLLGTRHQGDGLFRWIEYGEQDISFVNYRAFAGDSTGDGLFDTDDLVETFKFGEYEDAIDFNSTWVEGDWNGDLDFDSSDIIEAFKVGRFRQPSELPVVVVPEPSGVVSIAFALVCATLLLRSCGVEPSLVTVEAAVGCRHYDID